MKKQNDQSEQQNHHHVKEKPNWEQILRDWHRSGLSQEAFCRAQGIKYSTFVYWRVKALQTKEIQKPKSKAMPSFIPISLKQTHEKNLTAGNPWSIRLEFPSGIRLWIPSTLDRSALATLFSLLGISSC